MTHDPKVIGPDSPIGEALRSMREGGFRRLPVVEGGRLVGILSDRDLRQAMNIPMIVRGEALRRLRVGACAGWHLHDSRGLGAFPAGLPGKGGQAHARQKGGWMPGPRGWTSRGDDHRVRPAGLSHRVSGEGGCSSEWAANGESLPAQRHRRRGQRMFFPCQMEVQRIFLFVRRWADIERLCIASDHRVTALLGAAWRRRFDLPGFGPGGSPLGRS
jgi:hypothetical protein